MYVYMMFWVRIRKEFGYYYYTIFTHWSSANLVPVSTWNIDLAVNTEHLQLNQESHDVINYITTCIVPRAMT